LVHRQQRLGHAQAAAPVLRCRRQEEGCGDVGGIQVAMRQQPCVKQMQHNNYSYENLVFQ
jgi:hypothetical protein